MHLLIQYCNFSSCTIIQVDKQEVRVLVLLKYTELRAGLTLQKNSKNTCSPMCGFKSMYSRLMQHLIKHLMHYTKVVNCKNYTI